MKKKHKRYIVFIYDDYYVNGGVWDAAVSFDTLPECYQLIKDEGSDNNEIYDRVEGFRMEQYKAI